MVSILGKGGVMRIITVEACQYCPYIFEMVTKRGSMCKAAGYKIIKDQSSVPEWCPLDQAKEG